MNLRPQRRLAARLLKVGESRVWMDFNKEPEIELATTANDIRKLIHDGAIRARPERGVSRARARFIAYQRKKGLRKGYGRRKGTKGARLSQKRSWIYRVRAQRRYLRKLRDKGYLNRKDYRRLYRQVKGGFYRSVSHLRLTIREQGLLQQAGRTWTK